MTIICDIFLWRVRSVCRFHCKVRHDWGVLGAGRGGDRKPELGSESYEVAPWEGRGEKLGCCRFGVFLGAAAAATAA